PESGQQSRILLEGFEARVGGEQPLIMWYRLFCPTGGDQRPGKLPDGRGKPRLQIDRSAQTDDRRFRLARFVNPADNVPIRLRNSGLQRNDARISRDRRLEGAAGALDVG